MGAPSPPDYILRSILVILLVAVMAAFGQRVITTKRGFRTGLLALAVAASVGIHMGLIPEHYSEMPRLGISFVGAAIVGAAIAIGLIRRPDDERLVVAAGMFCLGEIVVWILFVTVPVPFFPGTPEAVESDAIISKIVEAVGVVLAVGLLLEQGELLRTGAGRLRGAWGAHADPALKGSWLKVSEVLQRPGGNGGEANASNGTSIAAPQTSPEQVPASILPSTSQHLHRRAEGLFSPHQVVDGLFSSTPGVPQALQEAARAGAAALLQSAIEAQVAEALGSARHADGERMRGGNHHGNGTTHPVAASRKRVLSPDDPG